MRGPSAGPGEPAGSGGPDDPGESSGSSGQGRSAGASVVPPGGLASVIAEQFSLQEAIGGVRGVIESVLPVVVFSAAYGFTRQLWPSAVAAVVVALLAVLLRVVTRQPVNQAISGLLGVAIGAAIALYTGRAVNFFAVSIAKNLALMVLYAGSALLRWPFVGVVLGFVLGEGTHWRQVPPRMRVYRLATWIWVGMCVVRLAFQIPLYIEDRATELGAASVPLGLPLFGLVLLLTWLVVRRVPVAKPVEAGPVEPGPAE